MKSPQKYFRERKLNDIEKKMAGLSRDLVLTRKLERERYQNGDTETSEMYRAMSNSLSSQLEVLKIERQNLLNGKL